MDAFRIGIAVLLLSIAYPVFGQETLRVGSIYQKSVKVFSDNGGMYLALPAGSWTLTSYEEWRAQPNNSPMRGGVLATLDGKKLKAIISFRAGMSYSRGWVVPSFCSRKDVYFRYPADARENQSGRETRCWGINHYGMTVGSNSSKYWTDAYQWAVQNSDGIPGNMIGVEMHRASGAAYLQTVYYHNPELEGFDPPKELAWRSSEWQKDRAAFDPKKIAYLERLKEWGAGWFPTYDAAFSGRPK